MNLILLLLISGQYSGAGRAVFASGKIYECQEIYLDLKMTETKFQLNDGGYRCGDLLHASFDPFKLEVRNGNLIHQNEIMGTISESHLSYEVFDPEDGSTYFLNLRKVSDHLEYHEEWYDGEKTALTVKGKLSPIN